MDIYIVIVFVLCLSQVSALLSTEKLNTATTCQVSPTTPLSISCNSEAILAIESVKYVYNVNCSTRCCNDSDPGEVIIENNYEFMRRECSGRSNCDVPFKTDKQPFGSFDRQIPSYASVQYYCLQKSRIASVKPTSSIESTGSALYLTNEGYPYATVGAGTWTCSAEVESCTSGLVLYILDADIYSNTTSCFQSLRIVNSQGSELKNVQCENYYQSTIQSYNVTTNYILINFTSDSVQNLEGLFMIGLKATAIDAKLTLKCSYAAETWCKDCGTPSVVNETVTLNTAGVSAYNATASVSCNSGYYPDKPVITCREHGLWDNATCLVIDCGTPVIGNGSAALLTTGVSTYGASANVSCNPGYYPDKMVIKCKDTGLWDSVTCIVKVPCSSDQWQCDSGQCIQSADRCDNAGTTCVDESDEKNCFVTGCQEGQKKCLMSNGTSYCIGLNEVCDCGTDFTVVNGNATLVNATNSLAGATAKVTCYTGHHISNDTITCNITGLWNNATCNPVDCSSPSNISNGNITARPGKTTYGETATVNCNTGYNATKTSVSCNSSGTWDTAQCFIKDCGSPPNISNGNITAMPGKTTYGETATVNCNTGYIATLASVLCNSSGTWDTAQCVTKDCGSPANISNGTISATPGKTTYGETATVNCIPGYNATQPSVSCNSSGTWDTAHCIIKDCGSPPNITNGYITAMPGKTTYGETATVNCNTGYNATKASLSCNNSGTWDTAQCIIKDCGLPPNITNGNITATPGNTTYGETATVKCNTGYNAIKTSVSCNSSGTWDTVQCVVIDCGLPQNITNGNITATPGKTTYGETATVNCNTGYNATKTSVSCNSSGIWDTAQCVIKDCGSPPNITNGNITAPPGKTTYGEAATVNCLQGYNFTKASVSCNSSGTWDTAQCVIIDCGSTPNISNGNITASPGKTTYGETATVNCITGYNSTKTLVSCNSSGTWDTAQCVIMDCGSPPNITNGNITATPGKTTYGETATVNCHTGYIATRTSVSCNSSRTWDTAQCVIKDCGSPQNITNGNITATPGKTTYGETATVNCDTGYTATKASVLCNSSGTWDTTQCVITDCGSPPTISNGNITATPGNTTYGETATVNCNTGYNATKTSVSCNSSGTWDTALCVIKDCDSPPNISNGNITATPGKTTYGETATVNCDTGYNATKTSVSCNSSGTWDTAQCVIKDCGSTPNITNGNITVMPGKTTYGETATVNCNTGYNATKASVLCNSSGTWDTAQCVIKDCGSTPNITNGKITATPGKTTYGETATVNCNTGYNATKESVSCNSSGTWDTTQCVIKNCGLPPNITNGNITTTPGKTTYGETAMVNCGTGYNSTKASVSCNSSGTWDTAKCDIKDCGSPPNITNGNITAMPGKTTYGETATVKCNTGYNATKASVSCNSSGIWDTAQCVIIDCDSPLNITNGNITAMPGKTTYGEKATVICNTGYNATQTSVSCNSSGTWDTAQCVIKDCGSPQNITNGNITASPGKTAYGETATVYCNTGYSATKTSVSCNSSATWDTAQCVIKDCGSPPNISNGNITATPGKTTYGETATVNCNTGYNATQPSVLCNSSGTWDTAQCVIYDGCVTNEWKCHDGGCINITEQCDHFPNCKDQSDELNCTGITVCPEGLLSCRHRNGSYSCISNGAKCDKLITDTSSSVTGIHLSSTQGNTASKAAARTTIKCISDGSCTAKDVTPVSPPDEDYKIRNKVVIGLAIGIPIAVILVIVSFFIFVKVSHRLRMAR